MSLVSLLAKKALGFIPGVSQIVAGAEMIGAIGKAVAGKKKPPTTLSPISEVKNLPVLSGTRSVQQGGYSRSTLPASAGRSLPSIGSRIGSGAANAVNALGTAGTLVYLGDMAIQAVHHGKKASSMLQNALPQTVDASQLRQYYRAPRGYVIVHDQATGQTIGVRKQDARQLGLWQPKPKPPISVKDWHAYKSAMRTEKKIKKVFKHSFAKHHARSSSACAPVHHRKPKAC